MNHIFYNHIFSGSLIIILGIFIMIISIAYIYGEYKKNKEESLTNMILDNLLGFLVASGPTGSTFGIFISLAIIGFGALIIIYGHNHA